MGVIVKPYTFATAGTILASEINSDFDTIYTLVNGNIDDANIKSGANINASKLLNASITNAKLGTAIVGDSNLNYLSVAVVRCGPTLPGTNGGRLARGRIAYTYVAGVTTGTVIFNGGSDDGNPSFAAAPRVVCTIEHAASGATHSVLLTAIGAASFSFEVRSSNAADVTSGYIHWMAFGAL